MHKITKRGLSVHMKFVTYQPSLSPNFSQFEQRPITGELTTDTFPVLFKSQDNNFEINISLSKPPSVFKAK